MSRLAAFIVAGFCFAVPLAGSVASAQTSQPHPLRPAESPPPALAPAQVTPKPVTTPDQPPEKAKRPRSPAQLANDERMRACGREWRAQKEQLKGRGLTWYRFSAECRARLKAEGR
ncbi:MAG TPA: hypothetical protein PLE50_07875 [Rhabdaerophilum sp.]|nr:hypothetical protein [Rhabdaerophilum sp.]